MRRIVKERRPLEDLDSPSQKSSYISVYGFLLRYSMYQLVNNDCITFGENELSLALSVHINLYRKGYGERYFELEI